MGSFAEARTRQKLIDPKLKAVGWRIVPYVQGTPLATLHNCAVTEYPTASGPADYALVADGRCGVVGKGLAITTCDLPIWTSKIHVSYVAVGKSVTILKSQIVTSKSDPRGGTRYAPTAFTEQGVAMLSSVLHSDRAIAVNIAIMRTFVELRRMLETHQKLARKLAELESRYDEQFGVVFEVLNELMKPEDEPRKQIGFGVREARARYGIRRASRSGGRASPRAARARLPTGTARKGN